MFEPLASLVRQRRAAQAPPVVTCDDAQSLAPRYPALVRGKKGGSPRILLLTSGLGSGHVRAAQAIHEAVLEQAPGAVVRMLDFWSLMDEGVGQAIQRAYLHFVTERPELYDRLHRLDQRTWRRVVAQGALPAPLAEFFHQLPADLWRPPVPQTVGPRYATDRLWFRAVRTASTRGPGGRIWRGGMRRVLMGWARLRLMGRLAAQWRAFGPDAVIATQMHPGAVVSLAKHANAFHTPAIGVLTDFGVHDFWIHPGIDRYCVATDAMAAALVDAGVERGAVIVSGIPLMPGFRDPPPPAHARRTLGLDPAKPAILVIGGGLGVGLQEAVTRLMAHRADWQILVATGRNADIRNSLEPLFPRANGRLQMLAWTEHMERVIPAADVVVGKPGGLTVAEVLACGRPLLATRSLRGQEGYNVRFLEEHHVGRLVVEEELPAAVESLLVDAGELARTQRRAWALGRRDGATRIANLVCELTERAGLGVAVRN